MSKGCLIGRRLRYVIGAPVADTAALAALPQADLRHRDGCLCVALDTSAVWVYDSTSTAVAGPQHVLSTNGTGRWIAAGFGGASGANEVGAVNILTVRGAATADVPNLAAFAVAGAQSDGLTYTEGQRILLPSQTNSEECGPYRVGVVAGGLAPLTRVGEADSSVEVTAGMLVYVSAGTALGNTWQYLTTDDPIVLDTTSQAWVLAPTAAGLTSLETRVSGDECDLSDAESSLASHETRISSDECDLSDAESSLGSIQTRLSDSESSVGSHETRISADECDLSDAESSLASIQTRLSVDETLSLKVLKTATITSDDLTTAGVGPETENIGSALTQNDIVLGYRINLADAFDNGAGVSLVMEVGHSNDVDFLEDGFNCFTGSPFEGLGYAHAVASGRTGVPIFDGTAVGQMTATFTAGADTLANFSNGSVTIDILGITIV